MSSAPRRALVLVDVQNDYASGPLTIRHPSFAESLPRILEAIRAANDAGIPVVCVQHTSSGLAPVFNPMLPGHRVHEEVEALRLPGWKDVRKHHASIYAGTDVAQWLRERGVDTVTLAGYQLNNCVLASAVEGEGLGLATEVLSDATGAIHLANEAGAVDARRLHDMLLTLLHSNWAAVVDVTGWRRALSRGESLSHSNLLASARMGARRADA